METSPTTLIQKHVVLVGAGNAHLVFLKRLGMRRLSGVAVTLVSESPVIPYSAMVPGHIAGDYLAEEITIDLVQLCRTVNARLVTDRALALDLTGRRVGFASRPELSFDVLSLGLGSSPACPPALASLPSSWLMRPLDRLLMRINQLEVELRRTPRPYHLVVVGGGASGCELSLALRKRFADRADFRLTLVQSDPRLLPGYPGKATRIMTEACQRQGIQVRANAQVTGGDNHCLEIKGGERLDHDTVLWATNAAPPSLLKPSGLPVNPAGFLLVRDTLQSVADPAVFGTGDCIAIESRPELPKNGVHAVRQGAVLFDNVVAFLREQPLVRFRPQRLCLNLLNTADGTATLCYGPFSVKSRLARRLKDRIDRAWIRKFSTQVSTEPPAEEAGEEVAMRCGGCGSKISSDVLSAVLRRLDVGDDPRILLGCRAGEDAAVHRLKPDLFGPDAERLVEVQTVDYFKAFVDDPFLFGQIAALHSLSDLYAMNARPFSALAIATLPYARGPILEGTLYELLSGAVEVFRAHQVTLTGGHTTEGSELALGFAVTGHGEEGSLFVKSGLKPGDQLVLTKPLGTGALLAAWMRGQCPATWFEPLTRCMLQSNAAAATILHRLGAKACTDVTGFGLAGHLLEMLDASKLSARLDAARIPLLPGFTDVVGRGIVSSLQRGNARSGCRILGPTPLPAWLFDPQTSGGLLAALRPEQAHEAVQALLLAGGREAGIIGEVLPLGSEQRLVVR